MADSLTPITSDQLSKVTTAKDTDLVTLGINGNFVVMTLANLKEVLGINALNTNTLEALTLTSSGNLSPRGMQYIAYDNLWARIHLCFAVSIDVPANGAICTLPITVQTINNIGCVSPDGTVYPFRFESDKIYTVNSLTVGKLIEINLTVAR